MTTASNTPELIDNRFHIEVGDFLVIPGTSIRFEIVEVNHHVYSTDIVYDRAGVLSTVAMSDEEMLQVTPA
jgi:hypothetical protein